ncbi:MAG: hypothetical protein KAI66_25520 [Lentisphaeria bacterium]|nr:hypothetical protein [Lentisphaeria bacterium]
MLYGNWISVVCFESFMFIVLALAGASMSVTAADLPPEMAAPTGTASGARAFRVALQPVWRAEKQTIAIVPGDKPASVTVKFPGTKCAENQLLVMRFRLRMVTKSFGGWNNFLCLDVNGSQVTSYTADGEPRLLNRAGNSMKTSSPKWPNEAYFKSTRGSPPALLTTFGPDWDTLEPRFVTDRREMYWFVLDITDLAREEGENSLTLTCVALAHYFKKTAAQMSEQPLLIDRLEIGTVSAAVRGSLIENLAAGMASFMPVAKAQANGLSVEASAGGTLRISYQGDRYFCRSSFSEAGAVIRHNRFWWTPTDDWKVTAEQENDTTIVVTGTTASYQVRRKVILDGSFIRMRDTITSKATEDLGIMLKHELLAEHVADTWRLSGLEKVPVHTDTAANPTVHFSRKRTGLGAALLDTVMRAQMVESGGRRMLSFENDHFGLAPGQSYTFKWSIYVGGPDFWEFINAVRADWGANATIPGMYSFWRPEIDPHKKLMENQDKLRVYLRRKRIDIFSLSPWFEYYSPAKYWQPRSEYKKLIRETIAKIRAVQPDAKFLANTETFLYYAPQALFKGTLPAYWTDAKGIMPRGPRRPHDFVLSAAATKVIDATPWKDSIFRDKDGNGIIDLYYAGAYKDGGVNLKLFPTLDNYWFGKFNEMVDYLLDDCGLDGIYIDSFSYYHSRTYDRWDGHSVDIDSATGAIKSKYARLGLLTAPARRQWVKHITDRGKICYVNGKRSSEELQDLAHIGYMEAEWTFDPAAKRLTANRAAKAQLSAPLALGVRPHRWRPEHKTQYAQIIHKAVIAYLRHGALYCHYTSEIPLPDQPGGGEYGVLNHMFPFTPIELHEGWVVGKERIITTVSGSFTWPNQEKPICLRFDLRGIRLDGGFEIKGAPGAWQIDVSLKDWRETAVIMDGGQQ